MGILNGMDQLLFLHEFFDAQVLVVGKSKSIHNKEHQATYRIIVLCSSLKWQRLPNPIKTLPKNHVNKFFFFKNTHSVLLQCLTNQSLRYSVYFFIKVPKCQVVHELGPIFMFSFYFFLPFYQSSSHKNLVNILYTFFVKIEINPSVFLQNVGVS